MSDIEEAMEAARRIVACSLNEDELIVARALLASAPLPPWRDISSAPKDGTECLFYGPYAAYTNRRGGYHEIGTYWQGKWTVAFMHENGEPTHWMPLPSPPAGDAIPGGG
jgi:hypothetical protein